ncbi:MAG: sugar phosphate isomerase/epimerase [Peptococcaceae bacterium]|jgi:fatty-acyl-CoA synthase|nr:sugar phosphate isomerase/epimerase [Peptococcaceae bacterium]
MKLAFSTIGCPGWLWGEVVATAKDMGYDGIELRGIANKVYLPATRTFSLENGLSIRGQMEALGLEIPCLSTSAFLFHEKYRDAARAEVRDYLNLAALLGAPYIRVLADREAAPGAEVDEGEVLENLRQLAPLAAEKEVTLLVETNGVYADSAKLAALLEKLADPNLGALWDINHPYRFYGESPAVTFDRLKDWVRHVHIKDSLRQNGKIVYKMLGYGDVPVGEALALLENHGYQGFVALEWLKRWVADLEDPGIVFAHFPHAVKRIMRRKEGK